MESENNYHVFGEPVPPSPPKNPFQQHPFEDRGTMIYTESKMRYDKQNRTADDLTHKRLKLTQTIAIIERILGTISGRDKVAKVLKYVLDLIKLFTQRLRLGVVGQRHEEKLMQYVRALDHRTWRAWLRNPIIITKAVIMSSSRRVEDITQTCSTNLGLFRQLLRFGRTFFLANSLMQNTLLMWQDAKKQGQLGPLVFLNLGLYKQCFDTFYSLTDELKLLHKLHIWKNPGLYAWLCRQDPYLTTTDNIISLHSATGKLQGLQTKKLEYTIQARIKRQAMELSRDKSVPGSPVRKHFVSDIYGSEEDYMRNFNDEIKYQSRILQSQINSAYIEVLALLMDLGATSTDLLRLNVPKETATLLSLGSSVAGFINLWSSSVREFRIDQRLKQITSKS